MRILIALVALSLLCGPAVAAPAARADAVPAARADATPTGSAYHPVAPTRIVDTRASQSPVPSLATRAFAVAGRGGVPATGVTAVALTVTVVAHTSVPGYATVWPAGTPRPSTSSLSFERARSIANLVVTRLGGGAVDVFNGGNGPMDVLLDVSGYYSGAVAGGVVPVTPARLVDTRSGLGGRTLAGQANRAVQVTSRDGVPTDGVAAAVVNLTATRAAGTGYLTGYANGSGRSQTSDVVFSRGETVASLAVVPLGADGALALHNGSRGSVDVLVDLVGYVLGQPAEAPADGSFVGLPEGRILDTRTGSPIGAKSARELTVDDQHGVPAGAQGAVVVKVTAVTPPRSLYLTAYSGPTLPVASTLDADPGESIADLAIVPIGCDGRIKIYNGSTAPANALVDLVGYIPQAHQPCWQNLSPGGTAGARSAVSCLPDDSCLVATSAPGGAVVRWRAADGTWAAPTQLPSITSVSPSDLSCASATSCVIEGGDYQVAELSGTTWNTTALPIPAGPKTVQVESVSCPAAGACVAVGLGGGQTLVPLVWTQAAGQWTVAELDGGNVAEALTSVSCVAAGQCVAAGSDGNEESLVRTLSGGSWSAPTTLSGILASDISCVALTSCVLVDADGADVLSGSTWTNAPHVWETPGVSCGTDGACTLISVNPDTGVLSSVAESGGVFSAPVAIAAWATLNVSPFDLSCASASFCLAVNGSWAEVYS